MKKRSSPMPKHVNHAILTDNLEQLRVSGEAGARESHRVQAERRDKKAAEEAYYNEKAAAEEQLRREQTNEHIVPIDPEAEAA